MPVPASLPPGLAEYLADLEARVGELENPSGPKKLFACTTANLPDAAAFYQGVLLDTTENVIAHSDGSDWVRSDDGSPL